jgi:hypothetical protein
MLGEEGSTVQQFNSSMVQWFNGSRACPDVGFLEMKGKKSEHLNN